MCLYRNSCSFPFVEENDRSAGRFPYQKKVTEWETRQNVNAALTNAANYDAQAGYYKSTVQGLGSTLLTAGLSGLSSGLGVYSMAGGFGGSEGLFGSLGTKVKNISSMSRVKGRVGA